MAETHSKPNLRIVENTSQQEWVTIPDAGSVQLEGQVFSEETQELQQVQKERESLGHEEFATVNRRLEVQFDSGDLDPANQIKEHPLFQDNQRFDGIDKTRDNPIYWSQEDRLRFENELSHQYQKRLEHSNRIQKSSAPTFIKS